MNEPSIFTNIINGEIPSQKVYEDELTLAFLDIYSGSEAHTLVIPKVQVEFVWDLTEEDYMALMSSVRKVARRLRDVTGKKLVFSKVVGVDVPHAHVHLVPFDSTDELSAMDRDVEPDHAALAALADKLRFS